ncbi:MAG: enoyl-CoA hydratase/isomerase family protein [Bacteroidia bacterium]
MKYNNLIYHTEASVAKITINRESKLNALTLETVREIGQAIDEAIADKNAKGIIITGAGPKAFAAGADISEFLAFDNKGGIEMAKKGHEVFNKIENSKKPVIAAVNGFALGGGCELAMACHIRVASDNAKFGQPEVKLGIIPGYGGTQRLIQLVGKGKAAELLMTADMINAEEAFKFGLVNYVVSPDQLLIKCHEILNKIFAVSPNAVSSVITAINSYFDVDQNGFDSEIEEFGKCFGTDDFKEGTGAFLEKRKPEFK